MHSELRADSSEGPPGGHKGSRYNEAQGSQLPTPLGLDVLASASHEQHSERRNPNLQAAGRAPALREGPILSSSTALESSPTSKVVVIDVDPGEKCASLAFCMRSLVTPESGRMAGNQPADLEPIRDGGSCGPHARSQGHFKWLSVADGRHPAPRNVSCNPRTRLQRRWHRHSDH